ncbi:MAG: decarboxylating 6-phosphogluconate dehydrogenase [Nitrospina sp.]|nr:MAG: decarboxylating 6-phosphogluconate dehydrogenase [Nitrospina sp.]
MKIGFVGLGKMGGNMVERLLLAGHEVVAFDRSPEVVAQVVAKGAVGAESFEDLARILPDRKIIWLMVPAGAPVDESIATFLPLLRRDDILIDGGNSYWRDTQKRAEEIHGQGVHFIDCGTSGGIWGLKNGYCLMYGGPREACDAVDPIFKTLAPPQGALYAGPSGAGHFVKMVHNGIEYGMMQAYAEGFELMNNSSFDIDLHAVSQVWQHGSVVRSWLLELAERALGENPQLDGIADFVQDSGEGRWMVQSAMDFDTPVPVITMSLFARFQSRQKESFGMKLLAALRNQFGGHATQSK